MSHYRKQPSRPTAVTMRDVARIANVSQSTVSRVLSGATDQIPIGEETRRRVLDAVQQLGYQRNLHAGSLRGQKTQMLAVMIADIANPFYHPLVRAVQDAANVYKYDVMVTNTDHTPSGERHFVESVIRRPVDGIVIVPYHLGNGDIDEIVGRTGAAVGVVGQHISHPQADVAFGNDGPATYEAVTWLIEQRGHRRVGFIGVATRFPAGARRQRGYKRALKRAGLEVRPEYVQYGDWAPASGFHAMQALLAATPRPTAVFVCNDLMAIGALDALHQAGLSAPDDMALVGFDDIPAASWLQPRLTTIAQHPHEMGTWLAQALFERLKGDYTGPGRRCQFPCRFIERESA